MANAKGILYSAEQTPPPKLLIFSAIQHALLLISLGIALPVTVSRAIGLDAVGSAAFLSSTLFCLGIAAFLQSMNGRFLGGGYQILPLPIRRQSLPVRRPASLRGRSLIWPARS